MGGVVECGLAVDTKTSPRRAAIEKAQAELQQEFDIREERRRELEFLEKGGNPLDFKFVHGGSISVQSTSHADQHAEPYVTSEAKGSFTLAASPHGDSVESSGRPAGFMGREPNIGDNLLLLDGENNKIHGERNAKHKGKRGSAAILEQSSQVDGHHNVRETDGSAILRLGAKSQAYERRNRSRKSRDYVNIGLTDSGYWHGNRASTTSPNPGDTNESLSRLEAEDPAVASTSNSIAAKTGVDMKKDLAADDQVDVKLTSMQNNNLVMDMILDVPEGGKEVELTENLQENDSYIQHLSVSERAPKGTSSQSCDITGRDDSASIGLLSIPHESCESKDMDNAENINGSGTHDKTMTSVNEDDLSHKNHVESTIKKNSSDAIADKSTFANGTCNIQNTDCSQPLVAKMADGISGGDSKDQTRLEVSMPDDKSLRENNAVLDEDATINANASTSPQLNHQNSVVQMKDEACDSRNRIANEVPLINNSKSIKLNDGIMNVPETKMDDSLSHSNCIKGGVLTSSFVSSASVSPKAVLLKKGDVSNAEFQTSTAEQKKAHEDAILREARLIEARIKRVREVSASDKYFDKRPKCHWDFVLEEMTWMANDFMQERLWKVAVASQISRQIAACGQTKFEQANIWRKQKNAGRSLARAVMQFWHAAEVCCNSDRTTGETRHDCRLDRLRSTTASETEVERDQVGHTVQNYAVRFLKHNGSTSCSILVEAPTTPDCQTDSGVLNICWEDQHSEESLFYTVPPGAMQAYRESLESQWIHYKKFGNSLHQDDEISMCNSVAGGLRESVYEEDEGETGTYLLPGNFEVGLTSKHFHKKRKLMQQKSSVIRLNDGDYSYEPCLEGKSGNQSFLLNGKRTSSTFNVGSFPTKRVRTASRQRVVSPCPSGVIGPLQMTSKADASSEDTSSFLDDQSSLHGGSMPRRNSGFETVMDSERQLPYDGGEISSKSKKKKKKPKHLGYKNSLNLGEPGLFVPGKGSIQGSSYERRLQADHVIHHEQRELVKKRTELQNFDSNGTSAYGQLAVKKPKEVNPATGSFPSPVMSQMSNMSNSNKLIKIIANRDRTRKNKVSKMAAGQSGLGSPWSNFEDQALVVLVHDMGPNWELVSDAINNTLQFKCIFRKPKECKERHKLLMDKSAGDGADSAEDSGSSQPYPSTLPGIPKGSARQLFQRLQGPMEEDILKTHFEKIILLGQKLSSCSRQIASQETKQITPAHSSHVVALSQVCPNNLSGGILTPLDLCETISSSPDGFPLPYQGSHPSSLAVPNNQGSMSSILPTSGVNTVLQGSTGTVLSNSLPSASAPLNPSSRDSQRYSVTRPCGVPVDESQRMQQYSQMLSGRTLQQPNMSMPGALPMGADRGVRMLPVPSGMGMMPGMNRGMPLSRPTFQGINSQGMLNVVSPGNMISSGHGVQNSVSVHPNVVASPANSMMRPREPLQMLRPGQNLEEHRQMMMQEMQMQSSQANGQSVPPFSGISSSFSNAMVPASIQPFPVQQHQQPHQMLQQPHILGNPHHHPTQGTSHSGSQPQAYTMRTVKERQLQHQMMPQTQHHITGPNAVSTSQSNSQIQPQSQSCSPVTPVSSSQGQPKQQNVSRNPPSGMSNQMMKQRHRQQVQHNQPRQQQQQRQQAQQQAKVMKGIGRGSMLVHQNLSADASQVSSSISTAPKNQVSDKHMMQQGQGFFPSSTGLSPTLHQPGNQKSIYAHPLAQAPKQMSQSAISDTGNQGTTQNSPSNNMLTQQAPIPSSISLPKQHQQTQQRYLNQSQQSIQRIVLQQSRHMNSDVRIPTSTDQGQIAQVVQSASIAPPTDASTSVTAVSSATLWNPEPAYDKDTPNPTTKVVNSAQETVAGSESSVPSSSQSVLPHQVSGGISAHGRNIGGQWQPHQIQQQQQQQPPLVPPPPPQHQQEQQHSRHTDLGAG